METLSFDRHLRHAFAPLSGRLENGIRSLDGVIEMLRLRIEAEAQFAASLQRIISNQKLLQYLDPSESLRKDGIDAIHADMRNEYTQRVEFLNSLNEDVYQPIVSTRELYAQKNRLFANDTKTHIKALRQHQNQFYKIKSKYEKVCKEASNARTSLLNAKLDSKISSAQILKLGSKVNNTLKTQQTWKEKYDQQQLAWNRQQIKFDDEMTSILQGMQSNEYNRMSTTKDSLNKWAVFVTNLCANRNYDVKNLATSMSLINIDVDLQIYIKMTLEKFPSKNPNGPTPPHHSLHYGKVHQNALSMLNKASVERNHDSKVNTNKKYKSSQRNKSIKRAYSPQSLHSQSNTAHQRHRSNNSLSLSSFGPSINGHRKGSASYSLSGQIDIANELAKRKAQTPSHSIGGFFKTKFQKQRSYNSQHKHTSHEQNRENSNTVSSYHGPNGVVLPPTDSLYDLHSNGPTSPKSAAAAMKDPEIPASPSALSIDLTLNNHGSSTHNAPYAMINKMKKKKLNKPKIRRKKKQSLKNSSRSQSTESTPNTSPKRKPITPIAPITPNQNTLLSNGNRPNPNPSSKTDHSSNPRVPPTQTNHNSEKIIRQLSRSPKSKANQIIIVKTRKKSSSTSANNNSTPKPAINATNVIAPPESSEDNLSGGSTPTLSGGESSDDETKHPIIADNEESNLSQKNVPSSNTDSKTTPKPDTPLPMKKKKFKISNSYMHKSNESANLQFAANQFNSNSIRHSYAESEDDFDPLD